MQRKSTIYLYQKYKVVENISIQQSNWKHTRKMTHSKCKEFFSMVAYNLYLCQSYIYITSIHSNDS